MQDIIYNPTKAEFKAPIGGLTVHNECSINILITKRYNIYNLRLVLENDDGDIIIDKGFNYKSSRIYNNDIYNEFTIKFKLDKPYIYFYHFEFNDCYGMHFIGRNDELDAILTDDVPVNYQINVSDKEISNFPWYQGKIMYQILVDRFNRSSDFDIKKINMNYKYNYILHKDFNEEIIDFPYNGDYHVDFFGGSLKGIEEKLDYLKSLNVSVIYLNPIFLSPTSHKYNTSDYLMIDPMYGTINDFRSLIEKAKEKDIYIILDGVFNHTGDDSIYFNKYNHFDSIGAYQSKSSIFHKWYDFKNFEKDPNDYKSWWGIKTLPSVNQNSNFVSFITEKDGVINTWMQEGIKGFRLDVVDEINDKFVSKINKAIKSVDKDSIVIGEVWEDATNKCAYSKRRQYFNGHELDSVMNYPIKDGIIDYLKNNNLRSLVIKIRNEINNYHFNNLNLLMNILGTHDTPRIITTLSNVNFQNPNINKLTYRLDKESLDLATCKLKMAYMILYTLPGIPCIYYGDEVAIEGFQDPYCRRSMDFNKESSIKELLLKLGEMRKDPLFIDGIYQEISWDNSVFIYSRSSNKYNYKYLVIINNNSSDYEYNLETDGYDVTSDAHYSNEKIIVKGNSGKILKIF